MGQIRVTYHKWIPICEWCVLRCGSKNGHQTDIFLKEIGVLTQNMLTILDILVNNLIF